MVVDCTVYDQRVRLKRDATIEGVRALGRRDDSFVWVALVEPTVEEFATVSSEFDLHELAVEDADHVTRLNEQVEGFRELLTGILQANLTQVSVRQNDDMRRISAWVAIIAVPTMIAGIYGMNFDHMPELGWRFGYPGVLLLLLIAVACSTLYVRFRRAGWL